MSSASIVTEVHRNKCSGQMYLCIPKDKGFEFGDQVRVVLLFKKGEESVL